MKQIYSFIKKLIDIEINRIIFIFDLINSIFIETKRFINHLKLRAHILQSKNYKFLTLNLNPILSFYCRGIFLILAKGYPLYSKTKYL